MEKKCNRCGTTLLTPCHSHCHECGEQRHSIILKDDDFLNRGALVMRNGLTTRTASISGFPTPGNIRWVIATEQPALVYDRQLDRVVNEVLLMDGVVYPPNNKVPLLDCHNRWTCDDQLGSVSDFQASIAGGLPAISGLVNFAKDDRSQRTMQKILDNHLTDGSAGYQVLAAVWVPDGIGVTIRGKSFAGPLKVSTEWALKEFTLTPIGADSLSKYMGTAY